MFSDHERETLVELETRLLADDPTWAMAFCRDCATSRYSRMSRTFVVTVPLVMPASVRILRAFSTS
mgnify:CR=1 FL=1